MKYDSVVQSEPDPRSYTPANLAQKILRDRFRLEGERRRVTILFVDTVESTTIAEQLDEEVVYTNIQLFVEEMLTAVHRFEGTVTQFTGDGVLAIFGAPIAHEDSARRAVAAAIEMRDRLFRLAEQIDQRDGIRYRFRIGLNTGPVVVGKITEDLSMQYSAIGDTVNLAARMEQMADPDSIFMTEETFRLVSGSVECQFVGPLDVKGKSQPVNVYKFVKDLGLRTRLEAAVEKGLTPYVGRGRELSTLQGFFDKVRSGRGQVVFVSGEAGIGKSRLLYELRQSLGSDVRWLEGHCISFGRNMSYLPIVDILKGSFGIVETDDDGAIVEKVEAHTAGWSDEARAAVPYLRFLLNVDPGDPEIVGLDPRDRRAGILNALRHLIAEGSKGGPIVLVIEDLHWIDERSEEAIAALMDPIAGLPVLMILNYRPGYKDSLGDRGYSTRLALDPLPSEDTEEIAKAVLRASDIPAELRDLIIAKAEGNPFYVEEVTKSLAEVGAIGFEGDHPVLLRPMTEIRIPENIHEIILSRIDRLESDAKQALQLASVIGREFTVRLLERISNIEGRLEIALSELRSLEIIYEKSFFPELAYMFKHALTHDVAYSTLLKERRKALHLVVARAIEELYADRVAEHVETIAHHYWEAQDWANASHYSLLAGEKAYNAYASEGAMEYFGRAIEAGEKAGTAASEWACTALMRRSLLRGFSGDTVGALSDLDNMRAIASRDGNRTFEAAALNLTGILHHLDHNPEPAEEALLRGLAVAEEHGLDDQKLLAYTGLIEIFGTYDRLNEAIAMAEKAKEVAARVTDPFALAVWGMFGAFIPHWRGRFYDAVEHIEAWAHVTSSAGDAAMDIASKWAKALALGGLGAYEESLDLLTYSLERSEKLGEVMFAARILNTIGWVHSEIGDLDGAERWNMQSLELALSIQAPDPEVECNARLNLADVYIRKGMLPAAEEHLRLVERVVREPTEPEKFMLWRYSQHFFHTSGEWHLLIGNHAAAMGLAEECIALARQTDSKKNVVKGLRLLAQAQLAMSEPGAAWENITEAVALARELGNPPQLWRSLAVMSEIAAAEGRAEESRAARDEARRLIEDVASSLKPERRQVFLSSGEAAGLGAPG